jgi:hypothetical protein
MEAVSHETKEVVFVGSRKLDDTHVKNRFAVLLNFPYINTNVTAFLIEEVCLP